jgi:hypothetical protein
MTSGQEVRSPPPPAFPRGLTLVLTNVTKLAGVVIALNEALIRADQRPMVLALAGFMMAGAQLSETLILAFLERLFGGKQQ